ncbi:hypothetical protein [Parabacteroides johnsonii]|uniref:hypothetical protein n=1 Tax=Parabacteroides johnsonii TaxID=387661 RepID=UPI0011DD803C|nr:hypothetical protein [Parabacteroides johnsonii]
MMKKKKIVIGFFLFFFLKGLIVSAQENMLGNQTQNEGFFAVPAKGNILIDGDASDWDLSGQIQSFGDISIRESYSVKTAAMWDKDNLYLFYDWRDPQPLNSTVNGLETPDRGWRADAEQMRIKADGEVFWFTFWSYLGKYNSFEYCRLDPSDMWKAERLDYECMIAREGDNKLNRGVESAYKLAIDGKGFTHEIKIPWKNIFIKEHSVKSGDKIQLGLEFLWGDNTGKGWPAHKVVDNMQPGKTDREFYWVATDVWGDMTLSDQPLPVRRKYIPQNAKKQGSIAIETEIPEEAVSFTLAIDDEHGNRIRNLIGGESPILYTVGKPKNQKRHIRVMWDGKDDNDNLVNPGRYKVRGLFLKKELNGQYEMSFYNPGTLPWATLDGTGDWGADHSSVHQVISSGNRMILVSDFAEGGTATFAVDLEGQKIWGETKGASVATANSKYFYSIPNDWGVSGNQILRLDVVTGKFVPFVQNGTTLPMPYPLTELYGINVDKGNELPKVYALVATDSDLALLREDGMLYLIDPDNCMVKKQIRFKTQMDGINGIRLKGKELYYFLHNELHTFNIQNGMDKKLTLKKGPEKPIDIAFDKTGNLYIADVGQDMQIKKYTSKGKYVGAIGKKGGRARAGKFEQDGMRFISSVDVDSKGNIWVAECSMLPRRVSVWSSDGMFLRDYIGNTSYSGGYTWLHDNDPSKGYAEGNELILNKEKRTWKMDNVVINPEKGELTIGIPVGDMCENGHAFYSTASGKKHEYFVAPGNGVSTMGVFMRDNDGIWKAVSGIFYLSSITRALKGGEIDDNLVAPCVGDFVDCNPADIAIWSDKNNDGKVQRKECEIVPAAVKARLRGTNGSSDLGSPGKYKLSVEGEGWYRRANPDDLSFMVSGEAGVFKVIPTSFTQEGAPVYTVDSWKKVPLEGVNVQEVYPIPGTEMAFAVGNGPAVPAPKEGPEGLKTCFFGFNIQTGKILWKYPSPYHQVHGSHSAPMAQPGLVIGATRVCGVIPECGDASSVFMVRGNLGEDYWFTTDGLFISSFFKDCRLPAPSLPATEDELRKMRIGTFSGNSEHFCGWTGRQDDGVIRMTCAVARQTAMIVRMEGLEDIRYIEPLSIDIDEVQLNKARQDNLNRELKAGKSSVITIKKVQRDVTGKIDWKKQSHSLEIARVGLEEKAKVKMYWDKKALYVNFEIRDNSPWKNRANDMKLLFKGGDAVDVSIRPSMNIEDKNAINGDVRFIGGIFNDRNVVLEMREKAANCLTSDKHIYSSPVSTFVFESVRESKKVDIEAQILNNKVNVMMTIPWSEIGLTPREGLKFRGDLGIILSNTEASVNVARIYWSNKNTNLVNDIPHEAKLEPSSWGEMMLEN